MPSSATLIIAALPAPTNFSGIQSLLLGVYVVVAIAVAIYALWEAKRGEVKRGGAIFVGVVLASLTLAFANKIATNFNTPQPIVDKITQVGP